MKKKKGLFFIGWMVFCLRVLAQLPDGSIAPDFTAQDINGQTHHLYSLLEEGKIVVLEISATWCPPCWVYHNSHAMQELYQAHGPNGDDKLRVLWVEGDPNTNLNCLYGPAGCNGGTAGNYVENTPYPILNNSGIANAYQISYYPTIYIICPNKKTQEVSPIDADALWEKAHVCPVAKGDNNAGIFDYYPGTDLSELCGWQPLTPHFNLTNIGSSPLTQATITLKWNDNPLQTIYWTGSLNTYQEAIILFDTHSVSNTGILSTTILEANGLSGDDDFSNNIRSDYFSPAAQFNTTKVLLKIRTDNFGAETYWEVHDDADMVLESGGNHDVGPQGGGAFPLGTPIGPGTYSNLAIIRDTLHLPSDGCYSIHFSDAYGDGMCCNYGPGYYRLYNLNAPTQALISGGEFGDYARRAFGVGATSATHEWMQSVDIQLYPNPANDFLHLEINAAEGLDLSGSVFNSLGQLQHSFALEKTQFSGNDWMVSLANWPAGVYFVQINLGGQRMLKRLVVSQ